MEKIAQKRKLLDRMRDATNLKGKVTETFFDPELKSTMESIRHVDDTIRSIATGHSIGDSTVLVDGVSLKQLLDSSASNARNKEYMASISNLSRFRDKIEEVIGQLMVLQSNTDTKKLDQDIQDSFLFRGLDPEAMSELQRIYDKSKPKDLENVQSGAFDSILSWVKGLVTVRGRAIRAWEKMFPEKTRELRTATDQLINTGKALFQTLLGDFERMSQARTKRDVNAYLESSKLLTQRYLGFDQAFKVYYAKYIEGFLAKQDLINKTAAEETATKMTDQENAKKEEVAKNPPALTEGTNLGGISVPTPDAEEVVADEDIISLDPKKPKAPVTPFALPDGSVIRTSPPKPDVPATPFSLPTKPKVFAPEGMSEEQIEEMDTASVVEISENLADAARKLQAANDLDEVTVVLQELSNESIVPELSDKSSHESLKQLSTAIVQVQTALEEVKTQAVKESNEEVQKLEEKIVETLAPLQESATKFEEAIFGANEAAMQTNEEKKQKVEERVEQAVAQAEVKLEEAKGKEKELHQNVSVEPEGAKPSVGSNVPDFAEYLENDKFTMAALFAPMFASAKLPTIIKYVESSSIDKKEEKLAILKDLLICRSEMNGINIAYNKLAKEQKTPQKQKEIGNQKRIIQDMFEKEFSKDILAINSSSSPSPEISEAIPQKSISLKDPLALDGNVFTLDALKKMNVEEFTKNYNNVPKNLGVQEGTPLEALAHKQKDLFSATHKYKQCNGLIIRSTRSNNTLSPEKIAELQAELPELKKTMEEKFDIYLEEVKKVNSSSVAMSIEQTKSYNNEGEIEVQNRKPKRTPEEEKELFGSKPKIEEKFQEQEPLTLESLLLNVPFLANKAQKPFALKLLKEQADKFAKMHGKNSELDTKNKELARKKSAIIEAFKKVSVEEAKQCGVDKLPQAVQQAFNDYTSKQKGFTVEASYQHFLTSLAILKDQSPSLMARQIKRYASYFPEHTQKLLSIAHSLETK